MCFCVSCKYTQKPSCPASCLDLLAMASMLSPLVLAFRIWIAVTGSSSVGWARTQWRHRPPLTDSPPVQWCTAPRFWSNPMVTTTTTQWRSVWIRGFTCPPPCARWQSSPWNCFVESRSWWKRKRRRKATWIWTCMLPPRATLLRRRGLFSRIPAGLVVRVLRCHALPPFTISSWARNLQSPLCCDDLRR